MIPFAKLRKFKKLEIWSNDRITAEIFKHFTTLRAVHLAWMNGIENGMHDLIRFNVLLQEIELTCSDDELKDIIECASKTLKESYRFGIPLDIRSDQCNVRIIQKKFYPKVKLHFEIYENILLYSDMDDYVPDFTTDDEKTFITRAESVMASSPFGY